MQTQHSTYQYPSNRITRLVAMLALGLSLMLHLTLANLAYAHPAKGNPTKTKYCIKYKGGSDSVATNIEDYAKVSLQFQYHHRGWVEMLFERLTDDDGEKEITEACYTYDPAEDYYTHVRRKGLRVKVKHGEDCYTKQKAAGKERLFEVKRKTNNLIVPWKCHVRK